MKLFSLIFKQLQLFYKNNQKKFGSPIVGMKIVTTFVPESTQQLLQKFKSSLTSRHTQQHLAA